MRELLSCDGGLSGEHLISRSVMKVLAGADGYLAIGGTPWLGQGEMKIVGEGSLTGKCLCERHNSRLHPLDDAAKFLFASLKNSLEDATHASEYLVSGHDIERWLLKTLKALAASGNLGVYGEKLAGAFADSIRISDLLENSMAWPEGTGLYSVMNAGDVTVNKPHFRVAPIINQNQEIAALCADILGLIFVLALDKQVLRNVHELAKAVHQPSSITIHHPLATSRVHLSWIPGTARPNNEMSLSFVKNVSV